MFINNKVKSSDSVKSMSCFNKYYSIKNSNIWLAYSLNDFCKNSPCIIGRHRFNDNTSIDDTVFSYCNTNYRVVKNICTKKNQIGYNVFSIGKASNIRMIGSVYIDSKGYTHKSTGVFEGGDPLYKDECPCLCGHWDKEEINVKNTINNN